MTWCFLNRSPLFLPPWVILYMHNKPHKLSTWKQQSITKIPAFILFFSICVCSICVCAVIWLPAYPTVSSNLAKYRYSLLFSVVFFFSLTQEANGFLRNEPLNPAPRAIFNPTVLKVAAALGFCRSRVETGKQKKQKRNQKQHTKRTACSEDRIQHCYKAPVMVWKCSQP